MNSSLAALSSQLPAGVKLSVAPVRDAMQELCAEEQAMVEQAIRSRQQEFASARILAHQALQQLGFPSTPLLANEDRSPQWPQEILGSLSHSRHWCAALIAQKTSSLLGLGVDVEDDRPLKQNLFAEILTGNEMDAMEKHLPLTEHSIFVLAVFGMKEAVYKAMHPLGNHGLGFHAMEVDGFAQGQRPKVKPLQDLERRLPAGCLLQLHHIRQNKTLLSIALLLEPTMPTA
ncbi:MAG: 4'-phosphopantetheinyl transferase superfamily protein [Planctomycetota bacterium]